MSRAALLHLMMWAGALAFPPAQGIRPTEGAHGAHLTAGPLHRPYACEQCHDAADVEADVARPEVSLSGWDSAAGTCAVWCHGSFPGGRGDNVPRWEPVDEAPGNCGACHSLPPGSGAHGAHALYPFGNDCSVCHDDSDFPELHADGKVDVIFGQTKRDAPPRYEAGSCSQLYCHSNARGTTRAPSWRDGSLACSGCHDDETSRSSGLSGPHALHLRSGVACADCHRGVVDRAEKRIIDRRLHVNRQVEVELFAGSWETGSCRPGCHEPRSW